MTTSYQQLEQALENAYILVQSMKAIIGVMLDEETSGTYILTREELKNITDNYDVEVVPEDNYITINLKAK